MNIYLDEDDEKDDNKSPLIDPIYGKLLKHRIIWLGDAVTNKNSNAIAAEMILLDQEDPKQDIYLFINSPGGSVYDGMTIFNAMNSVKADIVTVGIGLAASMAQFLLSSGTKGKRYVLPYSRVMMHQPSGGVGGKVTDIRDQAKEINYIKDVLADLTAKQTGKSKAKILEDIEHHDNWFSAKEAQEYGFVDHVISSIDELKIPEVKKNNK